MEAADMAAADTAAVAVAGTDSFPNRQSNASVLSAEQRLPALGSVRSMHS
jgi:hypothetical protein